MTDPVLDPTLRWEDLNTHITGGYARIAHALQRRVDPDHGAEPTDTLPVWFAIAVWASREVGAGLVSAGQTERLIAPLADGASVDELIEVVGAPLPSAVRRALEGLGVPDELAAALAVTLAMRHDDDAPTDDPGHLAALLDPRVLAITATRVARLIRSAPGEGLVGRTLALVRTTRNMFEDGNRRIFTDIGLPAQRFLATMGPPSGASAVLAGFALPGSDGAPVLFDQAAIGVREGRAPSRFEGPLGEDPEVSTALVVAGLACLDEAAVDPARRDLWIRAGNNLLAWREQRVAVQPAFTPPAVLPGEVDRAQLFAALTPTVRLPVGGRVWALSEYAPWNLPARDRNPLTPRVTEVSWAAFEDRWPCILDAFEAAYRRPRGVWPLPGADPRRG